MLKPLLSKSALFNVVPARRRSFHFSTSSRSSCTSFWLAMCGLLCVGRRAQATIAGGAGTYFWQRMLAWRAAAAIAFELRVSVGIAWIPRRTQGLNLLASVPSIGPNAMPDEIGPAERDCAAQE